MNALVRTNRHRAGWGPPTGSWRGVAKEVGDDGGDLLVTIAAVGNVAQDGCTSSDVTAYGYEGKHLELTVRDITGCLNGNVFSWIEDGGDEPFFGTVAGSVDPQEPLTGLFEPQQPDLNRSPDRPGGTERAWSPHPPAFLVRRS